MTFFLVGFTKDMTGSTRQQNLPVKAANQWYHRSCNASRYPV